MSQMCQQNSTSQQKLVLVHSLHIEHWMRSTKTSIQYHHHKLSSHTQVSLNICLTSPFLVVHRKLLQDRWSVEALLTFNCVKSSKMALI